MVEFPVPVIDIGEDVLRKTTEHTSWGNYLLGSFMKLVLDQRWLVFLPGKADQCLIWPSCHFSAYWLYYRSLGFLPRHVCLRRHFPLHDYKNLTSLIQYLFYSILASKLNLSKCRNILRLPLQHISSRYSDMFVPEYLWYNRKYYISNELPISYINKMNTWSNKH